MSRYIAPVANISDAWIDVLAAMNSEPGGTATNVMVTVEQPTAPDIAEVRSVLDSTLGARAQHSVATVANTLFPSAFYADPGYDWAPTLPEEAIEALDASANALYKEYIEILPSLKRVKANQTGTYFARMVSWPGKTGDGTNQLADRIHYFRRSRLRGESTQNSSDIAISGDGEAASAGAGLQEYAASDRRQLGFPCLVHIDLSAHNGVLSLTAVYRHWHLVTRGYGNMIGLAQLLQFLAQQTGYAVGELVVVAGYANAERGSYGGQSGINSLLTDARTARPEPQRDEDAA
jgi:hypothetical protein